MKMSIRRERDEIEMKERDTRQHTVVGWRAWVSRCRAPIPLRDPLVSSAYTARRIRRNKERKKKEKHLLWCTTCNLFFLLLSLSLSARGMNSFTCTNIVLYYTYYSYPLLSLPYFSSYHLHIRAVKRNFLSKVHIKESSVLLAQAKISNIKT